MEQNLVLLVTGASSGIGEATARLFTAKGWRVALVARRGDRLERLAEQIRQAGGQALVIKADLSRFNEIKPMVRRVLDEWGQIDVLFNNAGFGRLDWVEQLDPLEDVQAMIQVNLIGLIQATQAVLPHMIARRRGQIINMASLASFVATPTYSVYAASKYGVRGFTDALRREVSIYGIRISGIYPGSVDTEFKQVARPNYKTGLSMPGFLCLSSEAVARAVWRLARRPRRSLVIPGIMLPGIWLATHFPYLADKIMEWGFVRRERNGMREE